MYTFLFFPLSLCLARSAFFYFFTLPLHPSPLKHLNQPTCNRRIIILIRPPQRLIHDRQIQTR
jgi:hypothetical protein